MARRSQRNKKTKFTDPDADEDDAGAAGEEVAQSFTIKSSLDWIGVKPEDIVDLGSLDDEFKHIKKVYFKNVLLTHPDKGINRTYLLISLQKNKYTKAVMLLHLQT